MLDAFHASPLFRFAGSPRRRCRGPPLGRSASPAARGGGGPSARSAAARGAGAPGARGPGAGGRAPWGVHSRRHTHGDPMGKRVSPAEQLCQLPYRSGNRRNPSGKRYERGHARGYIWVALSRVRGSTGFPVRLRAIMGAHAETRKGTRARSQKNARDSFTTTIP